VLGVLEGKLRETRQGVVFKIWRLEGGYNL
jgi:hypothetical protein